MLWGLAAPLLSESYFYGQTEPSGKHRRVIGEPARGCRGGPAEQLQKDFFIWAMLWGLAASLLSESYFYGQTEPSGKHRRVHRSRGVSRLNPTHPRCWAVISRCFPHAALRDRVIDKLVTARWT